MAVALCTEQRDGQEEGNQVMRILMVGAGAIGGIIGGRLARAGRDVTFADVDAEQVKAIREKGLNVDVPDGTFRAFPPAFVPAELPGRFDLSFIAVRVFDLTSALAVVEPRLNPNATLVSLQNGLTLPLLEKIAGPDHAIGTMIRMRSRRTAPAMVRTAQRGHLYVGHLHGATTPQLQALHLLLNEVIPTEITGNIFGGLWSKLTYTCLGMITSLADASVRAILQDETSGRICVEFLGEVVAVGNALGARFVPLVEYDPRDFDPRLPYEARLSALHAVARQAKSEAQRGGVERFKKGVKTEIDFTVGHVVEEGKRVGVTTPICTAVVQMIHRIEAGQQPLQMRNYAELAAAV
jgi:2-dehydropantoate 2-reductase